MFCCGLSLIFHPICGTSGPAKREVIFARTQSIVRKNFEKFTPPEKINSSGSLIFRLIISSSEHTGRLGELLDEVEGNFSFFDESQAVSDGLHQSRLA